MSVKIFEVELESAAKGQRLCQHVIARSPQQAMVTAAAKQGRKAIGVKPWRTCTDEEVERAIADGRLAPAKKGKS